jgi:hypothetical protein
MQLCEAQELSFLYFQTKLLASFLYCVVAHKEHMNICSNGTKKLQNVYQTVSRKV